ncbi:MAG: hypothetical protein WDZ82_00395 [Candidatus Paceibacterota bacterium]
MKYWLKNNVALLIALTLPVILIVAIVFVVYVPRVFAPEPQYDLLYGVPYDGPRVMGHCSFGYEVLDGVLEQRITNSCDEGDEPEALYDLFVHRVADGENESISFDEARQLTLDENVEAPDGYSLVHNSNHRGIFELFGTSGGRTWYLEHGVARRSIELDRSASPYYYNIQFYGWIINE